MPAKNEQPDPRPLSTAPGETPKKKTDKASATSPAKKASARTRAPSKSAATEAPEKPAPRTRRKATNVEPPAVEATPRARRSPKTAGVAASAAAAPVGGRQPLDARTASDAQHATADVEAEVRVRAYMLSLARGDGPGSPDADWYQAEREIALDRQP